MVRYPLLLSVGLLPGSLFAQDLNTILASAEATYRRTSTMQAHFVEVIDNSMLGAPDTTEGRIYLSPPNRFAMRWTDPDGERIVADGTKLWLYAPSTAPGQVIQRDIPTSGAATPNLLGQFVDRPLERYTATLVGRDTIQGVVVDAVLLVPKHADLGFRRATVSITAAEGLVKRLDLVEDSGQFRSLTFDNIVTNEPIAARELLFTPPPNVRIVNFE